MALVAVLRELRDADRALEARIAEPLDASPRRADLHSLPRSGTVRAAALRAEIGDCRERFPSAEALAYLAGAAPRRAPREAPSGHLSLGGRQKLRDALVDFAGDSRRANPWAADLYAQARARGKTNPHAVRILARSWCGVIWRMWQDRVPYDPRAPWRFAATRGRGRLT